MDIIPEQQGNLLFSKVIHFLFMFFKFLFSLRLFEKSSREIKKLNRSCFSILFLIVLNPEQNPQLNGVSHLWQVLKKPCTWYKFKITIINQVVISAIIKFVNLGLGRSNIQEINKAAPRPIKNFCRIFTFLFFVKCKGDRMNVDKNIIPINNKYWDGMKRFNAKNLISSSEKIAVG